MYKNKQDRGTNDSIIICLYPKQTIDFFDMASTRAHQHPESNLTSVNGSSPKAGSSRICAELHLNQKLDQRAGSFLGAGIRFIGSARERPIAGVSGPPPPN